MWLKAFDAIQDATMYVTFCKKSILSWVNKTFGISAVQIIIIKFYTFNMIDNLIFSKDQNYQTNKPKKRDEQQCIQFVCIVFTNSMITISTVLNHKITKEHGNWHFPVDGMNDCNCETSSRDFRFTNEQKPMAKYSYQ